MGHLWRKKKANNNNNNQTLPSVKDLSEAERQESESGHQASAPEKQVNGTGELARRSRIV